ncbi:MAG: GNAT family N-acetyltransferase [Flavobacteriales bacterium]|nr:MAG: GNAT family N-acetyltransferase [Flavobacteriales bacterium]
MTFTLRPFEQTDLPALVKHANDATIAAFLSDAFPHPYTEEHGRNFLEEAINKNPPLRRCIDLDGECCGAIGLHPKPDLWRSNLELGYWLGKPYRGQGIMTEAIRQMVQLGFRTFPDINRIYASTFVANVASQRVLEKAGLQREAELKGTIVKNGVVHDELIYSIRRS